MGFRGKQIVLSTVVAAAVALSTCILNAALLARSRVDQMREEARLVAQTLYHAASGVIRRSSGESLESILREDPGLRDYADAVIGYSPVTLHLAIVDRDGTALFHSNPRSEGARLTEYRSLDRFAEQSVLQILWQMWREDQALVVDLPFSLEPDAGYGSVQVAVSSLLIRQPLFRAVAVNALTATVAVIAVLFVAFTVANRVLAPLEMLRAELSKIPTAQGEPPLDLTSAEGVGRVAQFFASVSERLGQESSQETHSEWLPSMLDGMSDAVLVLDRDRRILSLNERARTLLGLNEDQAAGTPIDGHLPDEHPVAIAVREALATDRDVLRRPCVLERDGENVPHSLNARRLRQGDSTAGLMVSVRDLDRLSRIASRLSYSQKLASLGRLTSGVAHEVKNPLNAIVMQSALLRRKLSEDEEEEGLIRHLDILDEEAHRLDRVVSGFLAFTRPDRLRLEAVDLERVVRNSLDKTCGDAESAGIRIEVDAQASRPTVPGDAALLEQVFCNLLTNARESMPGGGLLKVEILREADGIRVNVADCGMGIPEESIPKVFGLYFTTKERGSGIGLSIVYRIVQLHGGEVAVNSSPGQGTTVSVVLPEAPE